MSNKKTPHYGFVAPGMDLSGPPEETILIVLEHSQDVYDLLQEKNGMSMYDVIQATDEHGVIENPSKMFLTCAVMANTLSAMMNTYLDIGQDVFEPLTVSGGVGALMADVYSRAYCLTRGLAEESRNLLGPDFFSLPEMSAACGRGGISHSDKLERIEATMALLDRDCFASLEALGGQITVLFEKTTDWWDEGHEAIQKRLLMALTYAQHEAAYAYWEDREPEHHGTVIDGLGLSDALDRYTYECKENDVPNNLHQYVSHS